MSSLITYIQLFFGTYSSTDPRFLLFLLLLDDIVILSSFIFPAMFVTLKVIHTYVHF